MSFPAFKRGFSLITKSPILSPLCLMFSFWAMISTFSIFLIFFPLLVMFLILTELQDKNMIMNER